MPLSSSQQDFQQAAPPASIPMRPGVGDEFVPGGPVVEPAEFESARRVLRLDTTELRRRLWHMSPGLLPILLWLYPHQDPISPTLRGIFIVLCVLIAAKIGLQYRRIARRGENDPWSCVLGYAAPVLAMLLLFPGQAELGLTVLVVLAFGDGSATLGGLLFRGPKLPWNDEKTWSGTLCFLLVGVPMASLVYWGETTFNLEALGPQMSFGTALLCGGSAVLAAAIAESLPSRIDDNYRVGLAASATVVLAHGVFVGWAF